MQSDAPTAYHLGWDEFHRDTRALARKLLDSGKNWQGIIGIARGGLIPAAIIARELNIRLIDTLCISSYDHNTQIIPTILKTAQGNGSNWLLIDDLVDTGLTANIARELLPHATMAAIYAKPAGRSAAAYWQREFAQNTWIYFPWDIDYRYAEPLHQQGES
ncbi:MAG TPA: xanthine phosphoribosyltransferase [Spongiibacteraceae bacterium]|jgi:xanthine phosphoribosyltransferase